MAGPLSTTYFETSKNIRLLYYSGNDEKKKKLLKEIKQVSIVA